jgi:hypothetical protein
MESSTINPESFCELCSAQVVTYELADYRIRYPSKDEAYTNAAKHSLFHQSCDHCEDLDFSCQVQLCDLCRHLRVQHLLLCSPSLLQSTVFRLQSSRKISDHCELCKFWVAASASRGDESRPDEDAWHEMRVTGLGTFTLLTSGQDHGVWDHIRAEISDKKYRQWVPEYIDGEWLRDWLQRSGPGLSEETNLSPTQTLYDLRVIDVSSNCIIQMPLDSRYLALSYVWGSDSDANLRCTKSNVTTLSQAGILTESNLPRTILDAIQVCQWLGYRFLWVDRLCIIQDDSTEALSKQLDQMADIYNRAALTLVAATGASATHGLAGVSYARDSKQVVCKYGKSFKLVTRTPSLEDFLPKSTWWTRGWTYQEYIASKVLLFFTDYGVYLKNDRKSGNIRSEGFSWRSDFVNKELDLELIEEYTKKNLTHDSDILRASSGILRALYGHRSSYGMPWDDFDRAILWRPCTFDSGLRESTNSDVFPTWSWLSSMGPVSVQRVTESVCSLAYWSTPIVNAPTTPKSVPWSKLAPTYAVSPTLTRPMIYVRVHEEGDPTDYALGLYIVAALSWLYGCIQSEAPPWLSIDCTRVEYAARLKKHWPKSPSLFWKDPFQNYGETFNKLNGASSNEAGSLMVHTQMKSFALDWRSRHQPIFGDPLPGHHPVLIRTNKREIVGACELNEHSAKRLQHLDQTHATFIALSTCSHGPEIVPDYAGNHFYHLSVSAFYGCPCSIEEKDSGDLEHILECPEHAEFWSVEPTWANNYRGSGVDKHHDLHAQAYSHHLARLSYRDVNNELLHIRKYPPVLWVMLIAPRYNDGTQSEVYERIAIGSVYLKRWVESSPVFERLVLV